MTFAPHHEAYSKQSEHAFQFLHPPVLYFFLKKKDLFEFKNIFVTRFIKIILSSFLMGVFFRYLILFFENQLIYDHNLKLFFMIISVIIAFIFYLLVSFLFKAFNSQDLKLKY